MPQRIPSGAPGPSFTMRTSLDGVTFELTLTWNERESAWYLAIADSDGAVIRSGIRLALDWPLLRQVVDDRRPAGELYAIDVESTGVDAGREDLGGRVRLYYVTAAERVVLEA